MFFVKIKSKTTGEEVNKLYYEYSELYHDTFSPDLDIVTFIRFTIHGKDYHSRKSSLEEIAIDWSNNGDATGLYMSDLWSISDWFYRNGKRYGLLTDFNENGLI